MTENRLVAALGGGGKGGIAKSHKVTFWGDEHFHCLNFNDGLISIYIF